MIEIPVNNSKCEELQLFFKGEKDFVFFLAEDCNTGENLLPGTVFLMIHGDESGALCFGEYMYEVNEELLIYLVRNLKLEKKGVNRIIYNACHGGKNRDIHWNGYTLMCMHQDTCTTSMRIDAKGEWEERSVVTVFCKSPRRF